ncbi:hypothetical protein PAXINDRAFT_18375 [Paxillus involutus ATCC 200175]|uniref:Uncharacterized protein n=1 Tax=Paxillus involutus ATCC 200175 TaxID=664439 RepID=A0A0C9TL52_PAXIN|nr:hypothetical protein PAXINDRAFT_18375 [Paxillus involutus ATCC 200175]
MEQHLNFHHPEYAHPGKLIGVPLPSSATAAVLLTSLKEARLGVPVRPEFTLIAKPTNQTASESAGEKRRSANVATFTAAVASSIASHHITSFMIS